MKRIDLKKVVIFISLSLVSVQGLHSQDLGIKGITVLSEKKERGETVYEVRDAEGNTFTVEIREPLTQSQIDLLTGLKNEFFSWKYLKIDALRMIISGERAEIIVIPESFEYDGMNLAGYMPSGMQFYFDNFLEYDFRMKVNSIFLRMRGQYFGEKDFSEKLVRAVQNPSAYIKVYDPDFIIRKFIEIDKKDDSLDSSLKAVMRDYSSLKEEGYLLKEALDLLKEDNETLEDAYQLLNEAHNALQEAHNLLREDYIALKKLHHALENELSLLEEEHSLLTEQFTLLRYAALTLHNRGLVGRGSPIEMKGIERLIALKKENPSLTQKEAAELLKQEGISMTKREISLVFSVYFNEFE